MSNFVVGNRIVVERVPGVSEISGKIAYVIEVREPGQVFRIGNFEDKEFLIETGYGEDLELTVYDDEILPAPLSSPKVHYRLSFDLHAI